MYTNHKYIFTESGEKISGLLLIKPNIFYDERGLFLESWNKKIFDKILANENQEIFELVQENHSKSKKGVLRGLHYQRQPYAQAKLVRCISGLVFDVVLDLRKESKTFGKWAGINLSAEHYNQLWIPKGFAHGFLTLSNFAEINYKTTNFWYKEYEMSILWNDKTINIKWPLQNLDSQLIINQKDNNAKKFSEISEEFLF